MVRNTKKIKKESHDAFRDFPFLSLHDKLPVRIELTVSPYHGDVLPLNYGSISTNFSFIK